jgi:hypothetical protein
MVRTLILWSRHGLFQSDGARRKGNSKNLIYKKAGTALQKRKTKLAGKLRRKSEARDGWTIYKGWGAGRCRWGKHYCQRKRAKRKAVYGPDMSRMKKRQGQEGNVKRRQQRDAITANMQCRTRSETEENTVDSQEESRDGKEPLLVGAAGPGCLEQQ